MPFGSKTQIFSGNPLAFLADYGLVRCNIAISYPYNAGIESMSARN